MKAAVLHAFGQVPVHEAFREPELAAGEELARVTAAGLHPLVRAIASGSHYLSKGPMPCVLGVDGVVRTESGARFYTGRLRAPFGTMAERAALGAFRVPVPAALSDSRCAAIMNPGLSSWLALESRARLAAGERVLVLGATGAAGSLGVQIAKRLGAGRVVAVGRDEGALKRLEALGADETVRLGDDGASIRRAVAGCGFDVVLDYLWGAPAEVALGALAANDHSREARVRFVQIGASAGDPIALQSQWLRSAQIEILGSGIGSVSQDAIAAAVPRFLTAAPELELDVEEAPLQDVARVWGEARRARIVFVP